jgi:preprotein translocase subunit YajC
MHFPMLLQANPLPGGSTPVSTNAAGGTAIEGPATGAATSGAATSGNVVAGTKPGEIATSSSKPTATTQSGEAPGGWFSQMQLPLIMVLIFVVLYFVLFRGQRKEEKNRKSAISQMKKGDEVLLISGKFGKVVDIKDDRVVVKVDEANNVKETYLKSAIQKVIADSDGDKKKLNP